MPASILALVLAAATPTLVQLDAADIVPAFDIDPTYRSVAGNGGASMRMVNAYRLQLPLGIRIVEAHGAGFLPIAFKLSDGACYILSADYVGGRFANGTLSPTACVAFQAPDIGPKPVPPRAGLLPVNGSWGFNAWRDPKSRITLVTNTWIQGMPVLLSIRMNLISLNAMRSPDTPTADVTFVGTLRYQPMIVTFDLSF